MFYICSMLDVDRTDANTNPARAVCDQQIQMLTRLAETGLNIAAAVERQAMSDTLPLDRDWGLTYSRIARAVRQTIALQSKLMHDLAALDEVQANRPPAPDLAAKAERDRAAARTDRIGRIADRVIDAECDNERTVERLSDTLWERLRDDDIYGDLGDRPIGEIVALICKDLGLSPDWSRWAHEAWAVAEAETGAPGSPFVGLAAVAGQWRPETGPPMRFTPQGASP
jgi:hypothetical protein